MDDLLLELYLRELAPRLAGARIEKAYQYGDDDLALRLNLKPGRATLVLTADAALPLVALVDEEPPEVRTCSPLLEAVRARAMPGSIGAVEKTPGDRVVTLHLAGGHRLVAELVPRAPALLLLEADGRIVAALGAGTPGRRGLRSGGPYVAPSVPEPRPREPSAGGGGDGDGVGSGHEGGGGRSRLFRREIEARAAASGSTPAQEAKAIEDAAHAVPEPCLYVLADGRLVATPLPFVSLATEPRRFPTIVDLVAALYAEGVALRREERGRTRLAAALSKRKERLARTVERVGTEAANAADADEDRVRGELLLAWQKTARADAASAVRVPHPETDGAESVIPILDAELDLVGNARLYFERYREKQRAAEATRRRLDELRLEVEHTDELEAALEAASEGELPALEEELRAEGILGGGASAKDRPKARPGGRRARAKKTPGALEPRLFRASDGSDVLVGRSSRGNDRLTFVLARDEDFWLHADAPGSHVVLRNPGRHGEPAPATLLEAAALAAWFSRLRGATKAEVHWTRRTSVRRIPGAPPGRVRLLAHGSVRVSPALAAERFGLAATEASSS